MSCDQDRIDWPSGVNAQPDTMSRWPVSVRASCRTSEVQTLTVLSQDDVATVLPSELYMMLETGRVCARNCSFCVWATESQTANMPASEPETMLLPSGATVQAETGLSLTLKA